MNKQISNLVTLVAFVVYSICGSGCTSTARMPIDEVSVVPEKKITRLKLDNGADIFWSGRGADYDRSSGKFIGTFQDGSERFIRSGRVDSVFYLMPGNPHESAQCIDHFRSDESKRRRGTIRGKIKGLSTGFTEYEFDKHNGKIDSANFTVFGFTKQGDSLDVPFNEITTLKVKRFSAAKTTLLVAGVGALAFIVGIGIAMSDFGIASGGGHTSW